MRPVPVYTETYSVVATASPPPSTSTTADVMGPHSTWRSPVPYLFGGIAAMMGMIALALLILACSYWKLSGYLDPETTNGERRSDDTEGEKGSSSGDVGPVVLQTVHVAVIMAGQERPTYLATPVEMKNGEIVISESSTTEEEQSENSKVEEEERVDETTSLEESV